MEGINMCADKAINTGNPAAQKAGLSPSTSIQVEEATILQLQQAMEKGEVNSQILVQQYVDRIQKYDKQGPAINAIINLNADAMNVAKALDEERATQGPRSLLHGIPIILKDNYNTKDMPTTAGSVIFKDSIPPNDAFLTSLLRKAGAIILAKANLHELSFGISTVSSLGGQTLNPYDLERNPGGSSGGTAAAIAANFAVVGMGSDTGNSIRLPSANNNLVGLRPTFGLTSRSGLVPISKTQDVGGPIARTVSDLAIVMDIIAGIVDPDDPSTELGKGKRPSSYLDSLNKESLKGKKIGILTDFFGASDEAQATNEVIKVAIDDMKKIGVEFVDITIPEIKTIDAYVVKMEFEATFNKYLDSLGEDRPVSSFREMVEEKQYLLSIDKHLTSSLGLTMDSTKYIETFNNRQKLQNVILEKMRQLNLDAILYPTVRTPPALIKEERWEETNGNLCAHSGLPAISVPAGFTSNGLPVGLELLAEPFAEAKLISFGYAYEQATRHRTPPKLTP